MQKNRLTMLWKSMLIALGICFISIHIYAQSRNITGTIVDEKGETLVGATVKIKSGSLTTTTNVNGQFTLNVPPSETALIVTYIGYTDQEVSINAQSNNLRIQLTSNARNLNDVVVVGYGSQRRKDVTGSVTSVSEATLEEVPAPNLIAQLKGRAAGVTIVNNSSTPGAAGSIRIRGNRTITRGSNSSSDNADAPLIVLDGVPYNGSINDFSPDDVSSIDILKDASATAIYGSRGAGGVILVTTKRGRTGKAVITYDGYYGISSILGKYKLFNGPEFAQFKADAATYAQTNPGTTGYGLTQSEKDALAAGISTDWQDLIYQHGSISNNQINISGGSEKTQFGVGAGYFTETGIIPNQNFKRATLRTTIDHRVNDRIKVGVNSITTLSYSNTPGGGNVPFNLARLTPLASPYNADGTLNLRPASQTLDATQVNPLTLITRADDIVARNKRLRTFNSLYGEVNIFDGLRYRLNVGLDYRTENGDGYNPAGTLVNANDGQSSSNGSFSSGYNYSYNIQNLLYYDKTFAQKHKVSFTGLFEINKEQNRSNRFTVTGIPADYIGNTNFGLASGTILSDVNNNFFSERGLVSYMGRLNYGFDDRYLVTATVRVDGSSTLSPGNQYFTYPALGLGWNITNEQFAKPWKVVSNLKLRGGYGISGNRNVDPYTTLGLLSASAYNFGQAVAGQQLAYYVSTLANNALGWQSTAQWDVGLDFGLLNNRITGVIDVYDQKTKDILLPVALPASIGAGETVKNLGKTRGRGLEVTLTTVNFQSKNGFNWSTDLNWFFNREEITQLTTPQELNNVGNGWFVGQPLSVIYDVKKIGIWQTEDKNNGTLARQTSPVQIPGQIRVEDIDGNNRIDANDRQIIGNFQPKWEGGITNRFSYKGFDLSVVINARIGMKVLVPYLSNDGSTNGYAFFMTSRLNQVKVNYWTANNPTNEFPAPDANNQASNFLSTLAYRDGSFIRARSINFGYTVSPAFIKKAGLSTLRFYLNCTNPFIIYSPLVKSGLAMDPEGNGYGGAVTGYSSPSNQVSAPTRQVSVNINNPSTRQFILGVNARF
ncbi:TonB-dependent receptor [Mucilaginibacter sp. PAMB04168]|uniref:SusC/RagA family TonB-linked outer membrane protein n=1 Tax=Mucilaginibacter sp. PAMB04168 TaxID=3138567 RepID=UPI0031F6F812